MSQPTPQGLTTHPIGFFFFFWGEFAERCSYYGMRAILPLYLTTKLGLPDEKASQWYYLFKMGCYFLPLLGGWLADRFLGKYWTIVGFSVPYVLAQLLIGIETDYVVMLALFLCAMGSGVIKPNISALMGQTYDQLRPGNEPLRGRAFLWFYFSVNIGAFISLLALPILRNKFGYQVAFLVPAAFMAFALVIFALGKPHYAKETVGPAPPMTPEERTEQRKVLVRLLGVFSLVIFFWVVYEHNDTQWTFFARDHVDLRIPEWGGSFFKLFEEVDKDKVPTGTIAPDQFQFINALFVLVFVLFFQWFWAKIDPTGKRFPQTTKVLLGFIFTGLAPAFLAIAAQGTADGAKVSMLWIVVAYIILTFGEVLLYGTMLDLSYAYAPARMKGFITACFLVTNALGNLINSQYAKYYYSGLGKKETLVETLSYGTKVMTEKGDTVFRFSPQAFFTLDAAMCFGAAVAFYFVARQFNRNAKVA
jgi:POT family proton-dependent oligopeptide transporter